MAKFNQVLLVEGNDDKHVLLALCVKFELPHNFDIIDCTGIDPLIERLPVQLKASGQETLGILVDADENVAGRWAALRERLSPAFPDLPEAVPPGGLIGQNENGLKVGVWLMPDNQTGGMLEDFLRFLVPEGDPLIGPVDTFLDDLEDQGVQAYRPVHRSKARMHTWLGVQEAPGTPLGLSITKRYLSLEGEQLAVFRTWLTNLFA
jgi:hypothetical protein